MTLTSGPEGLASLEQTIRLDERITTLRRVLQITSDFGEPECHWEIMKLLMEAEKAVKRG